MTSSQIERALFLHFDHRRNLIVPRLGPGLTGFEADVVVVRPSGWAIEIEIKVSAADFRKEQSNKPLKHRILTTGNPAIVHRPWPTIERRAEMEAFVAAVEYPGNEPEGKPPFQVRDWRTTTPHCCREFWFAMPRELAEKLLPEIPPHAGLLALDYRCRILKQAPTLANSQKLTPELRQKLHTSVYHRFHDLLRKAG